MSSCKVLNDLPHQDCERLHDVLPKAFKCQDWGSNQGSVLNSKLPNGLSFYELENSTRRWISWKIFKVGPRKTFGQTFSMNVGVKQIIHVTIHGHTSCCQVLPARWSLAKTKGSQEVGIKEQSCRTSVWSYCTSKNKTRRMSYSCAVLGIICSDDQSTGVG